MTTIRRWKLTIKDKVTGNVDTYYEWGMSAQGAYLRAIKNIDEADAVTTNNYELVEATDNWKVNVNEGANE